MNTYQRRERAQACTVSWWLPETVLADPDYDDGDNIIQALDNLSVEVSFVSTDEASPLHFVMDRRFTMRREAGHSTVVYPDDEWEWEASRELNANEVSLLQDLLEYAPEKLVPSSVLIQHLDALEFFQFN